MRLPASVKGAARVKFGQSLVGLEIAVGGRASGVHDAFRDALMIEMGDFFAKNKIFEQRRASQPGFQGVLVIGNGDALVRREQLAFGVDSLALKRSVQGLRPEGGRRRF